MKFTAEKEPYTVIHTDYHSAVFIPVGQVFHIKVQLSDLEEYRDIVLHVVGSGETFLFAGGLPEHAAKKIYLSIVGSLADKGYVDCGFERDFVLGLCPKCRNPMEATQPHNNHAFYCPSCQWSAVGETSRKAYEEVAKYHLEQTIAKIREQQENPDGGS